MLLRLRRRLHVVMRIKIERFDRRVDIAGGKRRFGFLRTDRRIANAEISEAHVGQPFAVGARARCQTDNRVVAVTACQLGEADACGLVGGRNTYGGDHFLRAQGGFEQALEESVGFYFALSAGARDVDLAAECQ